MSYTVQNIIDTAALLIGVEAAGESLQPEEYADCLEKLNSLIQSWDVERLNIFCISTAQWPLTANRLTPYLIGTAGSPDFTGNRPVSIRFAAHVINVGGFNPIRHPMRLVEAEEYFGFPEQANTANVPTELYYDNDYPAARLYLHPWPNVASYLELETWETLGTFAATNLTFDLPPAYQRALEYNLAVDIAPMFGRPVPDAVMQVAIQSKTTLQNLNLPPAPGTAQEAAARGKTMQVAGPGTTPAAVQR